MRKLATILALAVALAVPTSALAADIGTTNETLVMSSTVTLTVPTSVTYLNSTGNTYQTTGLAINADSNNPAGLHVTAAFSNLTAGSATITADNRLWYCEGGTASGGTCTDLGTGTPGGTISAETPMTFLNRSTAGTVSASFTSIVQNVTIPGTYSGTISYAAVAN